MGEVKAMQCDDGYHRLTFQLTSENGKPAFFVMIDAVRNPYKDSKVIYLPIDDAKQLANFILESLEVKK